MPSLHAGRNNSSNLRSRGRQTVPLILCLIGLVLSTVLCEAAVREIDTSNATLRLDETTGDLVGITWKQPALNLIAEARLGENFRLLLPRPGYQAAYFFSRDQKVSRIEVHADEITCIYTSLHNAQEDLPIQVRYHIRSVGAQIQFSIEVENPTDRKLAEVLYGIVGGQQGIANRADTESLIPSGYLQQMPKMFTHYQAGGYGGGNLGIRYDAAAFTYPIAMSMGWIDIYNRKADLAYYYANQDPEIRLSAFYTEMRPFTKSSALQDNWPSPAEVPNGEPIGVVMGWLNFPYTSHGSFRAGPAALQVHRGDWHEGSHIYREWFDQHFDVKRSPNWLRNEMAWQSIIMSNSEDAIIWRFKDLPKLAADAKKYGITTFEICGWDVGGIDRGYPQYRPDPRLGTADEFRKALAEMKAIGVHPLIFSNIQFADTATSQFSSQLSKFAKQGLWAPDWPMWGWGEGTISARMGLTQSNMTMISPAHKEFRELLINQYLQLLKDGADGLQLDKALVEDQLDFNPKLPVSPDKAYTKGVFDTYEELLSQGKAINPNFAIGSENWFDRALPYVDVSYMRMEEIDMPSTAMRYTFPEWTGTIFGESPGDFGPMNNGLRYGLVWDLAPRHYNDSADEALTRPLSRYVQELIRIRTKYQDLLFHGRFNDTLGAEVNSDPDVRYSVFTSMDKNDKRRAAVLVNFGDQEENAELTFPGLEKQPLEVGVPFEKEREISQPARVKIAPHTSLVLVAR
jgi:hypothetical protein